MAASGVIFFLLAASAALVADSSASEALDQNDNTGVRSQSSTSISAPTSDGTVQGSTYYGNDQKRDFGHGPSAFFFYPGPPFGQNSLDNLYNAYSYTNFLQQYIARMQQIIQSQIDAQKRAAEALTATANANGAATPAVINPEQGLMEVHGAMAGGHFGPGGGFGSASLFPVPQPIPEITYQGGSIAPSSSGPGYHGVFSSASSSSSDINGQHKEEHSATFGVDDNGKVTIYNVHKP